MNKILLTSLILIVFLAGCTQYQNNYTQPSVQQPVQNPPQPTSQVSEQTPNQTQQTPTTQQTTPMTKEFSFEVDDNGYYVNGQKMTTISVSKDDIVKINFQVRTTNVYSGGLEMRGCGQATGGIPPGKEGSLQFTASSSCTITGYWPSTNIAKSSLQVSVG